jgi:acetylornithine/succinyldiaminopimelate/putrescine aminotransferase
MKSKLIDSAALFEQYAKTINAGHVEYLRSIGHDFIEAAREGAFVYDPNGKAYIDCDTSAGMFNLGRKNRELAQDLMLTMHQTDQGNFPMISREKADLAQKLAAIAPGNLDCSVFSVMRGEAFDFACKLARGATGRSELVSVNGSWFGQTGFAMSLSTRSDKKLYEPLLPRTRMLPMNDKNALLQSVTRKTAAVFLEPIQAENGCRSFGTNYLKALVEHCKNTGALLVVDETQTGLGRTGTLFAFEKLGLSPDMVILGEALGGGIFPIAVTLFTQKLNQFLNKHPMIHLSTFGGSDLGCRVAIKVLDEIWQTKPWKNAAQMGAKIKQGIERLCRTYPKVVASVQGEGLLLAMDLIDPDKARRFCKGLAAEGVLASPGVVDKSAVLLRPVLTLSDSEAGKIVSAINLVAKQFADAMR